MTVRVFAPAKINLTLHVTGQRDDGYHLLDSLVAFAPVWDELIIEDGNTLSLTIDGPEAAGVPADMNNLVLKAAQLLPQDKGAAITLIKNLPVASGIGGGSADAAAALRGLLTFWDNTALSETSDKELAPFAYSMLELGADIPMCLFSKPARVRGIGEKVEFIRQPVPIPALLLNPRVAVSTPKVFAALGNKNNPPMPKTLPQFADVEDYTKWLAGQRNDLQAPAISLEPAIGKVLTVLEKSKNCLLARMSGSGATCFGIFPDKESVTAAGQRIHKDHPEWWMAAGLLGSQFEQSLPR